MDTVAKLALTDLKYDTAGRLGQAEIRTGMLAQGFDTEVAAVRWVNNSLPPLIASMFTVQDAEIYLKRLGYSPL